MPDKFFHVKRLCDGRNPERAAVDIGPAPHALERAEETMKKLVLLRHAKSSWKDSSLADFERPLNERGRKAAKLMGEYMRQQRLGPDLVLCSPAQRAKETAALVLESFGIEVELRYDARIYEASVERLIEVISEIEETREETLLIGHNPGMENLLSRLTGVSQQMPTAAMACVMLTSKNWRDAAEQEGRLEWFVKPKELAGA